MVARMPSSSRLIAVGFVTDRLRLRPTKVVAGVFEDLDQQLFLGREVPIEDALAHADAVDEIVDRSWVVAVLGETAGGVVEQLSTPLATRFVSCLVMIRFNSMDGFAPTKSSAFPTG